MNYKFEDYLQDPNLIIKWNVIREAASLISTVEKKFVFLGEESVMTATVKVGVKDFIIEEAKGSVNGKEYEVDELKGLYGYISGKKAIKKKTMNKFPELSPLFLQCVSGLIQAETYVYDERGYNSKDEYNRYWDNLEEDGCRYYSNKRADLRASEPAWMEYVPDNFKATELFKREKRYSAVVEDGTLITVGFLNDTYHEMAISMELNIQGNVLDFQIVFFRGPGQACFSNSENSNMLKGWNIKDISKRDIIKILGGCDGCYHIVELAVELVDVIRGSL